MQGVKRDGPRSAPGTLAAYLNDVVILHTGDDCLFWPYARGKNGRARISFGGKNFEVHRIVCERVNGPAPTPDHCAAHDCGNGHLGCVSPKHILWKTYSENEADKNRHGTHSREFRSPNCKISDEEAKEIIATVGVSQIVIARRYGISQSVVSGLKIGRYRPWLREKRDEAHVGKG